MQDFRNGLLSSMLVVFWSDGIPTMFRPDIMTPWAPLSGHGALWSANILPRHIHSRWTTNRQHFQNIAMYEGRLSMN